MTETTLELMMLSAHAMLENGAETYRAEDTARRVGEALGAGDPQVFAFPTGLFVSVCNGNDTRTGMRRIRKRSTNLSRVNEVNNLTRGVIDGSITPEDAVSRLTALLQPSDKRKILAPALASALASGFFALFFRGGLLDFFVAALCGALTQAFASLFGREDYFHFIKSLVGGALTAFIALAAIMLTGMGHASSIIAGAMMPLLPGLAMTNAIRDTMRGDLVSGIARAAEALVVAAALACGAGVVMWAFQALGTTI